MRIKVSTLNRELTAMDKNPIQQDFLIGATGLANCGIEINLGAGFSAYVEEESDFVSIESGMGPVIVIGDFWDPFEPLQSRRQILDRSIGECKGIEDFLDRTKAWTGSYVTVVGGINPVVIPDAFATYQIFYGVDGQGKTWCGRSPEEVFSRIQKHVQLKGGHVSGMEICFAPETRLVGQLTWISGISQLEPHHTLDLQTGKSHRNWPTVALKRGDYRKTVSLAAQILSGSANAISNRHEHLYSALTAGTDSRITWCAMKSTGRPAHSFTFKYSNLDMQSSEIQVPLKLTNQLGGIHEIIEASHIWDGPEVFQSRYGREAFCLNSNFSEVARTFYRAHPILFRTRLITIYEQIYNTASTRSELDQVLRELRTGPRKLGWDIRDLFYWEQRMPHWVVPTWRFGANDGRLLNLFNCQLLFETFLGIKPRFRQGSRAKFFLNLMDALCPGASSVPINPPTQFKQSALRFANKSVIFHQIKWLLHYFRVKTKVTPAMPGLRGQKG